MKKENRMRSLAVLLAAVMTLGGCAGSSDTAGTEEMEAADTALAVEASAPETGSLAVSSTFIGTVSPQEQVSIIPLVLKWATMYRRGMCCCRLMMRQQGFSWNRQS